MKKSRVSAFNAACVLIGVTLISLGIIRTIRHEVAVETRINCTGQESSERLNYLLNLIEFRQLPNDAPTLCSAGWAVVESFQPDRWLKCTTEYEGIKRIHESIDDYRALRPVFEEVLSECGRTVYGGILRETPACNPA